jgi:mono/diheme cytochrome c family protein
MYSSQKGMGFFIGLVMGLFLVSVCPSSALADDQKDLVDRGRALFYGVGSCGCVVCHGVGGKGDGKAAKTLPVAPRKLSDSTYLIDTDQDGKTGTEADLQNILMHGTHKYGGGSGMVAWPDLTAADRQALAAFLKTLKDDQAGSCKLKCECVPGTIEENKKEKK